MLPHVNPQQWNEAYQEEGKITLSDSIIHLFLISQKICIRMTIPTKTFYIFIFEENIMYKRPPESQTSS